MSTMGVTMHEVLKFPLQSVPRSTDQKNKKYGSAEILFFTGIRYERHIDEDITSGEKQKEIAEKL